MAPAHPPSCNRLPLAGPPAQPSTAHPSDQPARLPSHPPAIVQWWQNAHSTAGHSTARRSAAQRSTAHLVQVAEPGENTEEEAGGARELQLCNPVIKPAGKTQC